MKEIADVVSGILSYKVSRIIFFIDKCNAMIFQFLRAGIADKLMSQFLGAGKVQLTSARLEQPEVASSILSDFNVCFDFPLICVAVALNTRKWTTDRWRGECQGDKGCMVGFD